VKASALTYLALGHIHKGGSFHAGNTLCAWPGCPMGRGYDEQGEKGVLIVTLEDTASVRFVPLDTPRFYDLEIDALEDAGASLASVLPAVGNDDFYRIRLTGPSQPVDLAGLMAQFSQFPNLELRDKTTPPVDVWARAGEDSFEGTYFQLLRAALEDCDEEQQRRIRLAARISRQILDGQEVHLP
jgi:DNA repair exonuclease SbcCD nuclease subunit